MNLDCRIEVLSSQAALAAFTRVWRQTRAKRKTTPRLAFGSIAELFSAVSEKRLELARHVAGDEGLQIRPLARALVEKNERGGLRAPFDEIVIRAGLRKAA